jgi:hypothetical protein
VLARAKTFASSRVIVERASVVECASPLALWISRRFILVSPRRASPTIYVGAPSRLNFDPCAEYFLCEHRGTKENGRSDVTRRAGLRAGLFCSTSRGATMRLIRGNSANGCAVWTPAAKFRSFRRADYIALWKLQGGEQNRSLILSAQIGRTHDSHPTCVRKTQCRFPHSASLLCSSSQDQVRNRVAP